VSIVYSKLLSDRQAPKRSVSVLDNLNTRFLAITEEPEQGPELPCTALEHLLSEAQAKLSHTHFLVVDMLVELSRMYAEDAALQDQSWIQHFRIPPGSSNTSGAAGGPEPSSIARPHSDAAPGSDGSSDGSEESSKTGGSGGSGPGSTTVAELHTQAADAGYRFVTVYSFCLLFLLPFSVFPQLLPLVFFLPYFPFFPFCLC
jgi:hypothetical protein